MATVTSRFTKDGQKRVPHPLNLFIDVTQNTTGRIHHIAYHDLRKHPVSWHRRTQLHRHTDLVLSLKT
jgi:hypothetical protein